MRVTIVLAILAMAALPGAAWAAPTYSPTFGGGEHMGNLIGGGGGGPFQSRCPGPDGYLAGLEVTTLGRISTIKLICATRQGNQLAAPTRFGPDIGTPQDARNSAVCPNGGAINGISVLADGFDIVGVWKIDLRCGDAHGALPIGQPTYIALAGSAQVDRGFSTPKQANGSDECPTGYVAKGVWGRYGAFIDALGLICEWVPTDAPPASSPAARPIRHTGDNVARPFSGDWTVVASYGSFELEMAQFANNSMRGAINMHAPDGGPVTGNPTGPSSAHLSFSQPARQGSVDITLSPDGDHFYGGGQLADHTSFTWAGTRKLPSAAN